MAQNIEEFRNSIPVGDLGIIPLQSCSELGKMVNEYIVDWRKEREDVLHQDDKIKDSYIVNTKCSRFGSGEAKGTILDSIRGKDLYLLVDVTNYSIEYSLCGHMNKMSPDDHYSDLKRIITAAAGKARRINVIMPFLYESRQHKRTSRDLWTVQLRFRNFTLSVLKILLLLMHMIHVYRMQFLTVVLTASSQLISLSKHCSTTYLTFRWTASI